MAGSQLKNLKAALKAQGLTGQTNIKKNKKNTKRQAKDYDREEKAKIIAKIREDFNPFEVKASKNKKRNAEASQGLIAVGKPGISKQVGEDQRQKAFEAREATKNRKGGILDKRFGEKNKHLSEEEKMLERFTKERQSQSKNKKNLFNIDNDFEEDDGMDMFGTNLTHMGKSLSTGDGELGFEDEDMLSSKRNLYDEDGALGESLGPARKKTKAEVMKEIITKSKFHKQERQRAHEKMEGQIEDLDEDFDDIMSELRESAASAPKPVFEPKAGIDKEYDVKVKELLMERRAAPTDRTKTEEELQKEADDHKKKLEQQRLDRMNGIVEHEGEDEKGVEDLDTNFWGSDEEDALAEEEIVDSDDDVKFNKDEGESEEEMEPRFGHKKTAVPCPESHNDLLSFLKKYSLVDHPKMVRKVIKSYQPKLAEGNKEKLGKFTGVLLRHIIFLSNQEYSSDLKTFRETQNDLISTLRILSEKYNRDLSETCREIINEIQERFKSPTVYKVSVSDLVFFSIVGSLFSTSDQYHLVVTPCSILIAEMLEQLKYNTLDRLAFGSILSRIVLKYQRLSKRFIPELVYFFEKSLSTLLVDNEKIHTRIDSENLVLPEQVDFTDFKSETLHLHNLFNDEERNEKDKLELQKIVLLNLLGSVDGAVTGIWKNLTAFPEITFTIKNILSLYQARYPELKSVTQLKDKINKLECFEQHIPLTLQNHRPISIPSHAPKFEENFNPDKKSYDPDRTRSEIKKMKAQIKKERKFTMKEIRKDTKFEARQRIDRQKKDNATYHAKMSHIYNTISTEEGAEKNKYEKEKKLRGSKK